MQRPWKHQSIEERVETCVDYLFIAVLVVWAIYNLVGIINGGLPDVSR